MKATEKLDVREIRRKLGMNQDAADAYRKALEMTPERISAAERLRELTK